MRLLPHRVVIVSPSAADPHEAAVAVADAEVPLARVAAAGAGHHRAEVGVDEPGRRADVAADRAGRAAGVAHHAEHPVGIATAEAALATPPVGSVGHPHVSAVLERLLVELVLLEGDFVRGREAADQGVDHHGVVGVGPVVDVVLVDGGVAVLDRLEERGLIEGEGPVLLLGDELVHLLDPVVVLLPLLVVGAVVDLVVVGGRVGDAGVDLLAGVRNVVRFGLGATEQQHQTAEVEIFQRARAHHSSWD